MIDRSAGQPQRPGGQLQRACAAAAISEVRHLFASRPASSNRRRPTCWRHVSLAQEQLCMCACDMYMVCTCSADPWPFVLIVVDTDYCSLYSTIKSEDCTLDVNDDRA